MNFNINENDEIQDEEHKTSKSKITMLANIKSNFTFVSKNYKTPKVKQFYDFCGQNKIAQFMQFFDSSMISNKIKDSNFFRTGQVSFGNLHTNVGNGKTIMVLKRIKLFLDEQENKMRIDSTVQKSRILILVPKIVYMQWIEEMIAFFGFDFVNKYVYCLNHSIVARNNFDDSESNLSYKIVISKLDDYGYLFGNCQSFLDMMNFHFMFVDEAHQLFQNFFGSRKEDLFVTMTNKIYFVWFISATVHKFTYHYIFSDQKVLDGFDFIKNYDINDDSLLKRKFEEEEDNDDDEVQTKLPDIITIIFKFQKLKILHNSGLSDLTNTIIFEKDANEKIKNKLQEQFTSEVDNFFHGKIFLDFKLTKFNKKNIPSDELDKITKYYFGDEHMISFDNEWQLDSNNNIKCFNILKKILIFNGDENTNLEREQLFYDYQKIFFDFKQKKNDVLVRILDNLKNSCGICFDDPNDSNVIYPCCKQAVCQECLKRWIIMGHQNCPHCRATLDFSDFKSKPKFIENKTFMNVYFESMVEIIKKHSKILVVYTNISQINDGMFKLDVQTKILDSKGVVTLNKILNNFKKFDGKMVLFVPKEICGVGFNLQFIDAMVFLNKFQKDAFDQMLGRAQRYGRTTSLHVYKFEEEE